MQLPHKDTVHAAESNCLRAANLLNATPLDLHLHSYLPLLHHKPEPFSGDCAAAEIVYNMLV